MVLTLESGITYICSPSAKFAFLFNTHLSLLPNEEITIRLFLQSLPWLQFYNSLILFPFIEAVLPIWQQPR